MALAAELILTLHGIGSPHVGVTADERFYWIPQQTFVSLLRTIVATRPGSSLPVSITFDDGNESDALIALPELARRDLKATFFIVAGRIETPCYLDRNALRDIISAGMEIGTHGMNHFDWRNLSETQLHVEIADACHRIEDVCGRAVTKASVPFGSYDRRVLKQLRSEGLEGVFTSDGGLANSGTWLKPRRTIDSAVSQAEMTCLITKYPTLTARLYRNTAMMYKRLRG